MSGKLGEGINIYVTSYSEEMSGSSTMVIVKWPSSRETRFIVDFGIFQERAWRQYNGKVLYNVEKLDFAIVTHVHSDHTGLLPILEKYGFSGQVYCSQATRNYMPIMLNEVAERIKDDYNRKNKKEKLQAKKRKKEEGKTIGKKDYKRIEKGNARKKNEFKKAELLYDGENVKSLMDKVIGIELKTTFYPSEGIEVTFYNNGHVDGAVLTVVKAFDKKEEIYFCITGDIGVKNRITSMKTKLPKRVAEKVSFVISEATYGDDIKPVDMRLEKKKIKDIIKRAHEEKKRIVCPWYAFERSIIGIKDIIEMKKSKTMAKYLEGMPIFFDTKLGVKFMNVMKENLPNLEFLKELKIISTKEDRKNIKEMRPPYFLFVTSGQFNQGSIMAYPEFLEDENTIILFGGYVPVHVQNYMALEKGTEIPFNGQKVPLNAEMISSKYYSAHMGRHQIIEFLEQFKNAHTVLFHHGKDKAKQSMVKSIKQTGKTAYNMLYSRTIRLNKYGISKIY